MELNEFKLLEKRKFYYLQVDDLGTKRDNVLADLFDEEIILKQLSRRNETTSDPVINRYWKNETSAKRYVTNNDNITYKIFSIKPTEFIKIMENSLPNEDLYKDNYIYLKNIKFYEKEKGIQKKIKLFRSRYKCIDAYVASKDPHNWLECPNCGLKPLIWEFNNGSSTACGCGENIYKHFRIESESIMSYVTRHNGSGLNYNPNALRDKWNHWVNTGEILFDPKKEREENNIY